MSFPISWSRSSWVYNYLYNQYLLPIKLWAWFNLLYRGDQFNWRRKPKYRNMKQHYNYVIFSRYSGKTNKTNRHDMTKILLKVALNTTTLPLFYICKYYNFIFISILLFAFQVNVTEKWILSSDERYSTIIPAHTDACIKRSPFSCPVIDNFILI